ncbi:uncharacterized protein LOC133032800 [Cannabis sativa]|uniref:uncharacterized protein LOC133032800 n=1 Tax=Cannabis sativa TaxID=3483 RepID=UPI0029CA8EA7|nr:uncharacterized protein LOC133032800 [Cannabis sativa]
MAEAKTNSQMPTFSPSRSSSSRLLSRRLLYPSSLEYEEQNNTMYFELIRWFLFLVAIIVQVSDSDEEALDEVDDDAEDEHENDSEAPLQAEPVQNPSGAPLPPKESERQLSKKELKKKELEELEAVLAELGCSTISEIGGQDDAHGAAREKKEENLNGEVDKKENAGESKFGRKKKKKDKLKETRESQDQPDGSDVGNVADETVEAEKAEDLSAVDVKERLKKVTSMKKKKSSKEMDAAARAAASEAAVNAKLAAAKKKEKNHYNQRRFGNLAALFFFFPFYI